MADEQQGPTDAAGAAGVESVVLTPGLTREVTAALQHYRAGSEELGRLRAHLACAPRHKNWSEGYVTLSLAKLDAEGTRDTLIAVLEHLMDVWRSELALMDRRSGGDAMGDWSARLRWTRIHIPRLLADLRAGRPGKASA